MNDILIAIITGVVSIGGAWIAARSQAAKSKQEYQSQQHQHQLELEKTLWARVREEIARLQLRIDELEVENSTLRTQVVKLTTQVHDLQTENRRLKSK